MTRIVTDLQALHHPFTAPNPEDMKDLSSARALAYDMVYNGVEVLMFVSLQSAGSLKHLLIFSSYNKLIHFYVYGAVRLVGEV